MAAPIDLDTKCGMYLTFRDLVECGKTWAESARSATPIENRPAKMESVRALERLCQRVLDPVREQFGPFELTYGFSGHELSNLVKRTVGRVAPERDQHAAHEENSRGKPICPRGGAAADFRVMGRSSLEVAKWVVHHTPFDRLYFYGDGLPVHVSSTNHPIGQICVISRGNSGRRVPSVRTKEWFLDQ